MDEFTPEQKQIYKYNDGAKQVCGDPLELRNALLYESSNKLDELIGKLNEPAEVVKRKGTPTDAQVLEALHAEKILEAISRKVFGLMPYDKATGKGAGWAHALGVLAHFTASLNSEKKNTNPLPTTPPPSDATAAA